MGNNEARVLGTFFIWLAVAIIGAGAMVNAITLGGIIVFLIVAIVAGMGMSATQSIWGKGHENAESDSEKSKRRSRVDRVLERMDEADLDELRARLMSESDGEAVSINELLAERDRRRS